MSTTADEGYKRCMEAMWEAGRKWQQAHPFAELSFREIEADYARAAGKMLKPGERVAIVAQLSDVIDSWGANADARSLLRAMDIASEGHGTYMQARAILDHVRRAAIERATAPIPGGTWQCPECSAALDSSTSADGEPRAMDAGDLSVCVACGCIMRVVQTVDRFEALSASDLRELPVRVRKQLCKMRNAVHDRIKEERGRS